jgi:hypothetical protein
MVYQTDGTTGFYYYNGSAWAALGGSSSGWGLTGNSGTNPSTNFIGTTDTATLKLKVNNSPSGLISVNGNCAFGYNAMAAISGGSYNTAMGYSSLALNTTGQDNVAIGGTAMTENSSGNYNVGIGNNALYSNGSGYANTAIGGLALENCAGTSENVSIGYKSLYSNSTGSINTFIGSLTDVSSPSLTNTTAIGYSTYASASNAVYIGDGVVTFIGGYASWTNLSDGRFKSQIQENVPGLDFILKLRPVTYHFDARKFEQFQGRDSLIKNNTNGYDQAEAMLRTGFIAQEVEKAALECGYDFSGVHKPANEKDHYGLAYSEFTVPLVKAVQEQQKTIDAMKKQIDLLKSQNQALTAQLTEDNTKIKNDIETLKKELQKGNMSAL